MRSLVSSQPITSSHSEIEICHCIEFESSSTNNEEVDSSMHQLHSGDKFLRSISWSMNSQSKLKSSLKSTDNLVVKQNKHVQFACSDEELTYEETNDDSKNSWLNIDISNVIEAIENEGRDMIVSFGPTGRSTPEDLDLFNNHKACMVRIQKRRLINEMLGQRNLSRQSVLEEQARQKAEGTVDVVKLCSVASEMSQWWVELAKSSWWLNRS